MTGRPLISMVLIARDEQDNIEPCFNSWWPHVDEVVLCDTGSTDRTIARAREFAAGKGELHKLTITEYQWHDDFAAARQHADSVATGEWTCWCDLDDEIIGAQHLRDLASNAPAEVVAFMADYIYAQDPAGNTICTLKRERLVRQGRGTWHGRVHEAQSFDGAVHLIPPQTVVWRHRKQHELPTDRNLRILEKWAVDEPDNGRVLQYLGTERAGQGQHEEAVEAYERFLALPDEPAEYRAQCWRKLACSLIALDRIKDAYQAGVTALGEHPSWPDCYLTLAQTSYVQGRHQDAIQFAQDLLRRGAPDTLLIVNPLDYTIEPHVVIAGALAGLGRFDEAIQTAETVFRTVPDHPLLTPAYHDWRAKRKRGSTAQTWLSCLQLLVAHDEQDKALHLLEHTVPYYVQDHPDIVQARSLLRERLRFARDPHLYTEHYQTGGSKPEDMIDDERVTPLCEALPRVQFLARTIRELQEAA